MTEDEFYHDIDSAWRTKGGRLLGPRDFTNDHLMNTIHYIARLVFAAYPKELIEAWCKHDARSLPYYPPIYYDLIEEAMGRGLLTYEEGCQLQGAEEDDFF